MEMEAEISGMQTTLANRSRGLWRCSSEPCSLEVLFLTDGGCDAIQMGEGGQGGSPSVLTRQNLAEPQT